MKKLVSMLLVLTMVLALAGSAMAGCKFSKGDMVEFKCDSNSYNAAKDSKKTNNVVRKGSTACVVGVCGKFVKLRVNVVDETDKWFKACDLKLADPDAGTLVIWAKGGKGMSHRVGVIYTDKTMFKGKIKVTGHTNLRKTPSLHRKSAGVVEKCDTLKLTGRFAFDNRLVPWLEVCVKGKKLWVSTMYVKLTKLQAAYLIAFLAA